DAGGDHRAAHGDRAGRARGERDAARPPAGRVTAEALRDILGAARTIAVVGLSPTPSRPSHGVARYLREAGYRIVPVNPGHTTILAGGAARRYGGHPKGLVELGGRRILDRVVDVVGAVTGEPPLLVANAPEGPSWRRDLRAVSDVRPGNGSLGGIYTAVVSGAGPVLCVAWDMPFLTIELLRALLEG